MNNQPNDKMLKRIQNLLAMGEGSANAHEAEIAMRRANALLEQYNLSRADVVMADPSVLRFSTADGATTFRATPRWASILGPAIASLYTCRVKMVWAEGGRKALQFQGEESDAQVAAWTYDYLVTQINGEAERWRVEQSKTRHYRPSRSDLTDFRFSAASSLCAKIRQMVKEREAAKQSTGTDLVICKKALVEEKYGAAKYRKCRGRRLNADGYAAGNGINIRQGVGGQARAALR